jgi:hypothetical protein
MLDSSLLRVGFLAHWIFPEWQHCRSAARVGGADVEQLTKKEKRRASFKSLGASFKKFNSDLDSARSDRLILRLYGQHCDSPAAKKLRLIFDSQKLQPQPVLLGFVYKYVF